MLTHNQKILSKSELISENSLKIDLSSSQKTQRSKLVSSPTGWFAVVSYLISDDKRAVDSCLSLFVSEKLWKLHLYPILLGTIFYSFSFHCISIDLLGFCIWRNCLKWIGFVWVFIYFNSYIYFNCFEILAQFVSFVVEFELD